MSDDHSGSVHTTAREPGLISRLLALPTKIVAALAGSLLLSILIECAGVHWFWQEEGWHHARGLLDYELAQLSSSFTQSVLVREPGVTARRWVQTVNQSVFVDTGVLEWAHTASARAAVQADQRRSFRHYLNRILARLEVYVLAAAYTSLTFLVRVLVLCLTLPMFVSAAFVGVVDGLVRRDVRRFGAGRESGFLYHRARASIIPVVLLPWVTYLSLPVSVSPLFILLPCAVLLGVAVNVTMGSFKKYL